MNQGNNQEKKIVLWKTNTSNWSIEQFLEAHPEYKKNDKIQNANYWSVILILADQLGFDEDTMNNFFEEKPKCQLADIVFSMYVSRLYNNSQAEEFLSCKQTKTLSEIHEYIREQEALVHVMEVSEAMQKKEGDNTPNKNVEEVWNRFMESVQLHENTRKDYEKAIERLMKTIEDGIQRAGSVQRPKDWNRILKLEKENAVLKVQLESEKRESNLKIQTTETMKRMELQRLKDQIEVLIKAQRQGNGFSKRRTRMIEGKELNERENLILKILGSNEYPVFLKEYLFDSFQNGMDFRTMQTFDKPEIDKKNFEMMKTVINKSE